MLSTAPGLVAVGAAPESAPTKNRSTSTDAALFQLLSTDADVERRIYEFYKVDFDLFGYPRFDKATAIPPAAERTPNVEPILPREGRGPKKALAHAGEKAGMPGKLGKAGKLNKKSLSPAKLDKLNKMIKGDKVGVAKKDAA